MRKIAIFIMLASVVAAPLAAQASPKWTAEAKDKWMSEDAMKAEDYFNPVNGDV